MTERNRNVVPEILFINLETSTRQEKMWSMKRRLTSDEAAENCEPDSSSPSERLSLSASAPGHKMTYDLTKVFETFDHLDNG
ncbi:hypothetical protein GcM1_234042 [Golovinomyces cichoracearum]|uniref:Uncharacterized protein n=1 Tax=Golovinomyces cichoracearum TaxID=62708 RepID=A0A420ILE3_9PEZI|nr:hypothetical protein GcM1_234042 [Golovinomyces cichoracearum]